MGLGKTYSADYLIDSNGNTGVSGQVLISTATGVDWADGSAITGGPYLPLAGGTMTGTAGVIFPDNFKLNFGTGSDLQIFHNGSNSYIRDNGTGGLVLEGSTMLELKARSGETYLRGNENSSVQLYHNNNLKLNTTSTGVEVTGKITNLTAGTGNLDAVNVQQLNDATTGALIFKGTWSAASTTTSTTSAAVSSSTTVVISSSNAGISVGATVTGAALPAGVTVTAIAADEVTLTISSAQSITSGATLTFTTVGGIPDLSQTARKVTGDYYICETAGVATPNGTGTTPDDWAVGDWVAFSDLATDAWQKIDNSSVLSGAGTGGKVPVWSGTGTSVTLADAPITVSGNNATFAGAVTIDGVNDTYNFKAMATDTDSWFGVYEDANNSANIAIIRSDSNESFKVLGHQGNMTVGYSTSSHTINGTTTFAGDVYVGTATTNGGVINLIQSALNPEIRIQSGESGATAFSIYNTATNPDAEQFFINNNLSSSHLGNARGALKLEDSSGTALTLSSGNATFAGNVTATNILTVAGAATGNPYLQFTQGGSQKAYIQYADSADSFELQSDNQFVVRTGGSTAALTINSSQNATFANNVYADKGVFSDGMTVTGDMSSFETTLTNNEDWQNSPISILERGNVQGTETADKYSPNLNFHWGGVVSKSLWMGYNGHLNWGEYSSTGIPAADGRINATFFGGELLGTINTATTGATQTAGDNSTKIATTAYADAAAAAGGGNFLPLAGGTMTGNVIFPGEEANSFKIAFTGASASSGLSTVDQSGAGLYIGANSRVNNSGVVVFHDTLLPSSGIYFDGWSGDDMEFYTGSSGNPTKRLTIEAGGDAIFTGNVGIGDSGPQVKLQVSTSSPTNNVAVSIGDGWVGNDLYHKEGGLLLISGTSQDSTQTGAGLAFQTRNTQNTNYWKSSIIMDRDGAMRFTLGGAGTVQGSEDLTILSGGYVGIGTTSPSTILDVRGAGATSNPATSGSTVSTGTRFRIASSTTATAVLDFGISTSGKTWLQSTDRADLSTEYPLLLNPNGGNVGIGTTDPSESLEILKDGGAIIRLHDPGNNSWKIKADSDFHIYDDSNSDYLTILNNGNVGIGTTSPADKLHVAVSSGNYQIDGDSSGNIYHKSQSGEHRFRAGGGTTNAFNIANSLISTLKTAYFSSNVGIGTTSPSSNLHSVITTAGDSALKLQDDTGSVFDFQCGIAGVTGDALIIKDTTSSYDYLTLRSGNVGIGTTSPARRLDVDSAAVSDIARFGNNSGNFTLGQTTNLTSLDLAADNAYRIRQGSTVPFYVKSDGNVGIGTTKSSKYTSYKNVC